MADFSILNNIPEFSSAWNEVKGQITAEGGSGLDVQSAQDTLVKTYSDLTTGQLAVDSSDALGYAKDFTMTAKTVMGAVNTASGLIAAAKGASSPAQMASVANMFTGTMIAVATAAGAVSAGIGALIVAGAAVAIEVLQAIGLFGSSSASYKVCNLTSENQPTIVINCVYSSTAQPNQTGSAAWRTFPDPIQDPGWYAPPAMPMFLIAIWHGDAWSSDQDHGQRLIDAALPHYAQLEKEVPAASDTSILANFKHAFFTAWKANQEYAFNGLKTQPDWSVLTHAVRVWNKAHNDTSFVDLAAGNKILPYEATLMADVLRNVSANDSTNHMVRGCLRIHTGPIKTIVKPAPPPQKIIQLKLRSTVSAVSATIIKGNIFGPQAPAAPPNTLGTIGKASYLVTSGLQSGPPSQNAAVAQILTAHPAAAVGAKVAIDAIALAALPRWKRILIDLHFMHAPMLPLVSATDLASIASAVQKAITLSKIGHAKEGKTWADQAKSLGATSSQIQQLIAAGYV